MRHKISYDLFREMIIMNIAPKCAYINVSVNNEYEGLYVLMEKINGSMININKNDSMSMLFKDPPIFREEIPSVNQDSFNYYKQKFPKISTSDKSYYLVQFKDFLYHSTDEEFVNNILIWVDVENVIDWHLMLLFSNNSDGILKNFYMYKLDKTTPFRFALWDYDHSFGRDGDNEKNVMARELDCNRSVLLRRLMNVTSVGYLPKLKKTVV